MACVFSFVATIGPTSGSNWVKEMGLEAAGNFDVYVVAVEWAMQTLTTVGYGSVSLTNTDERLYVIVGMIVGGVIFSYVMGTMCTLVTQLMVTNIEFQINMDLLNE